MTVTTNVEQVKLNIMTQSQYDRTTKSDTELYVIKDATAMPMDDELSLSSNNPVKNSVITARSNQIQEELNDKLNKSTIWNKLNRAYAWTYRKLNGEGNAYLLYQYNQPNVSPSYSAQEIIENEYNNYAIASDCYYICLDKQLYYVQKTTSGSIYTFDLKPIGDNNCVCYCASGANAMAIINNNLYYLSSMALNLKDEGGWTKVTYFNPGSSSLALGIKDSCLYSIASQGNTRTLKDSSGCWTDVCGYTDSSVYGFGIKDGKLYAINSYNMVNISLDTGWTKICGYDANTGSDSYYGLGIKNGSLYAIKGNKVTLLNDTETWKKIYGSGSQSIALTYSGKIYNISSMTTLTQIGTSNEWTDVTGYFSVNSWNIGVFMAAVKNGDVYYFKCLSGSGIENLSEIKITNIGTITNIYNGWYNYSNNFPGTCCWTGSVTEDVHTVYTVPSPSLGFKTYSNTNLQENGTINSASLSPHTITDQSYTYTRDANNDGVFSGIPEDSSKQLMSMSDFLNCFTE